MKSQTRHRRPRSGNIRASNGQVPLHRNYVFDSNGPNGRLRGTAQQLAEKYQQLARDSKANGDRVHAQALYQYAEHYSRTLSLINQNMQNTQQERSEQRHRCGHEQRSLNNTDRRPRRERAERSPHQSNPNSHENSDENNQEESRQWRPSEEHNDEKGRGEE